MEMKKEWVRPLTTVQQFVPNEYCSSCGDTEYGKYIFTCNAGDGQYGGLYVKNTNLFGKEYYEMVSRSWNSYHACKDTHETSVRDDYIEGIFDPDMNHYNGNEVPCLIWYKKGKYGQSVYQGHASTGLTRDSWEVVKS